MARTIIPAQVFRVAMPIATHWERATCAEVDCAAYINGWALVLPAADADNAIAAVKASGRSYQFVLVVRPENDGMVEYRFAAGQPCFGSSRHMAQTERPALYIHGNRETRVSRVVQTSEWAERFGETLDGLRGIDERG